MKVWIKHWLFPMGNRVTYAAGSNVTTLLPGMTVKRTSLFKCVCKLCVHDWSKCPWWGSWVVKCHLYSGSKWCSFIMTPFEPQLRTTSTTPTTPPPYSALRSRLRLVGHDSIVVCVRRTRVLEFTHVKDPMVVEKKRYAGNLLQNFQHPENF